MVLGKRLPAVALFLIPSPPLPLKLIITYHFFSVFCNRLKASNEKAWMKSGTLRMMTLSSKSLRTNRGPGDLWNAKHFNKGLINFNACYAAFVKEE